MNHRLSSLGHRWRSSLASFVVGISTFALAGCDSIGTLFLPIPTSDDPQIAALLAPAPTLPVGSYDYFGSLKNSDEARAMVVAAGLDPEAPKNFARIGLIEITDQLIADGRDRFFNQPLGDPSAIGQLFSDSRRVAEFDLSMLDPVDPATDPSGFLAFRRSFLLTVLLRPRLAETNLKVHLDADLLLGSTTYPAGTEIDTGLDIAKGEMTPVGIESGGMSCALCHASVDRASGKMIVGMPNTDLNLGFFMALSKNTASSFLRFNKSQINPFESRFPRTGHRVLDSLGNKVQLPDPIAFEAAVDDLILSIPPGGFEAAADATTAETKIPDNFVFGEGSMGFDGGFPIGPFGGVAAFSSAVHAIEMNFLASSTVSQLVANIDPEVYLGIVLQNAGDEGLQMPEDVKPSEWARQKKLLTDFGSLMKLPGYPDATLFSVNGMVFSPPDEPFMYSALALSAFQQSLTVPPNTSLENQINLHSGAVVRGAEIFQTANCASCHTAPYFTNGAVIPNTYMKSSPGRAKARRLYDGRLIEAQVPSFDQDVPLPDNPNLLTLPPNPNAVSNLLMPPGLDNPDGGYKVPGLLGTYLKAPYLHDGSIAATADAIHVESDGGYTVVDALQIGIPGTTKSHRALDAGNSLRVLLDHDLRAILLSNNSADPTLITNGIEGIGHYFYVDPVAGYSYQDQADLIAFLLALDDNPGQ